MTSAFGGMAWLGGMEFVRGHVWGRRRPEAFLEGRLEDLIMHEESRERHVGWWAADVIDTGMSYICCPLTPARMAAVQTGNVVRIAAVAHVLRILSRDMLRSPCDS